MTWPSRIHESTRKKRRHDAEKPGKTHWIYVLIWNLLRLYVAWLLVFPVGGVIWICYMGITELPAKQMREAAKRAAAPATLCGKIAGVVYEFPKDYEYLWAEYEGKSSWEVGFVDNKKGCDASFVSVPLAIRWPEMTAASHSEASKFNFDGLLVNIAPNRRGAEYMQNKLTYLLSRTPSEVIVNSKYNIRLNLNFVRGGSTRFFEGEQGVFWRRGNGVLDYVGSCVWLERSKAYSRCFLYFLTSDGGAVISVEFLWERIQEWESIALKVKYFIEDSASRY